MVNTNKKLAFTLAEALVSMLILSIFIGLSMKIFTKKHTKPVYNPTHGYYICFRGLPDKKTTENITLGAVYEKVGAASQSEKAAGYCEFTPPKSANYFVVYAVGAGGGGNSSYGGAPGEFTTLFVTNIADPLLIYPGSGGMYGKNGDPTVIKNKNPDITKNVVLSVKGGLAGGETRIKQRFVRSCNVVPLAKMLLDAEGKRYLDNQSTDKAHCEVDSKGFVAKLCPHSAEDVRQEEDILKFYENYAASAKAWYDAGLTTYKNRSVDYEYDFVTKCVVMPKGLYKYCLRETGDKLYERPSAESNDWRYVGLNKDKSLKCKTEKLLYSQVDIDTTSDSSTVIRSTDSFKYMIDLHYDMSTINNTPYMKSSSFGKYLESSGLKAATQDVMFLTTNEWKGYTSNVAANQFEPSMGDGGAAGGASDKKVRGLPGAVFIAW